MDSRRRPFQHRPTWAECRSPVFGVRSLVQCQTACSHRTAVHKEQYYSCWCTWNQLQAPPRLYVLVANLCRNMQIHFVQQLNSWHRWNSLCWQKNSKSLTNYGSHVWRAPINTVVNCEIAEIKHATKKLTRKFMKFKRSEIHEVYSNNNNYDNASCDVIIVRVHLVHAMNAGWAPSGLQPSDQANWLELLWVHL